MKFLARVFAADGSTPVEGPAELVFASAGKRRIVRGAVRAGILELSAEPSAVWGLRVASQAVVAFALRATQSSVDLGELVLLREGIPWPVFHATDGKVFGLPRALHGLFAETSVRATPRADTVGNVAAARASMSFADAFGSAARQLNTAANLQKGLALTGATVKLKGVPTTSEAAIGLEFPSLELAATSQGLSELTFSLKSSGGGPTPSPDVPTGPPVPNVEGYTRDLALRKLSAAGFASETNIELVKPAESAGRVVRQIPRAGSASSPGGLVRLFIGKAEGA